jgi:hypothetical protein
MLRLASIRREVVAQDHLPVLRVIFDPRGWSSS